MSNVFDEGNLIFDFTACGIAERFDLKTKNAYGMKAVDFVADTADCLYFIEVKDFQNPNATPERRKEDYEVLLNSIDKGKTVFNLEMGTKIKDSLLRRFAEGNKFIKSVKYLLVINLDKLGEFERGLLKEKISGYIPTGLNDERFNAFTEISFDLVTAEQLIQHGISCVDKSGK